MYVAIAENSESLSILIPGQGPLQHRACLEEQKCYLRIWFAVVEARAWKWANTFHNSRPDKIFLVTGQTLTNEWAIAHYQTNSSECEILLELGAGVPANLDVNMHLGYGFQRATAYVGFNEHQPASDDNSMLYSVFFEVIESYPMNFFPLEPKLLSLISDAFRLSPS